MTLTCKSWIWLYSIQKLSFQTKSGKSLVAFLFNDFLLLATGSLSGAEFSFEKHHDIKLKVYRKVGLKLDNTVLKRSIFSYKSIHLFRNIIFQYENKYLHYMLQPLFLKNLTAFVGDQTQNVSNHSSANRKSSSLSTRSVTENEELSSSGETKGKSKATKVEYKLHN